MEEPLLDLNHASLEQLSKLVGIGRSRAEAIISYRVAVQGFTTIEELSRVPGIGLNVVESNRSRLIATPMLQPRRKSRQSWRNRPRRSKQPLHTADDPLVGQGSEITPDGTPLPRTRGQMAPPITLPSSDRESDSSNVEEPERKVRPHTRKGTKRKIDPSLHQTPLSGEKRSCLTLKNPEGSSPIHREEHRGQLSPHNHCLHKRIPTKEHPPPELEDWLTVFHKWTNAERLMALDRLVDFCDPTQVRHIMAVIEPQFQRDFISLLPKELALHVLSFLVPKDLGRAAQTCRYWRILAEDNLLWREKCREAGIEDPQEMQLRRRNLRKTAQRVNSALAAEALEAVSGLSPTRSEPASPRPHSPSPWKLAYLRQQNIELNWRSRELLDPRVLKGHDDHVITCLQFNGTRIVSGSDDNTLKVWSANSGKCLRTLTGHTGGVWSSQMSGSVVVSGSTDRTLKVWNIETGHCLHTLYGHTSTVRCLHMHANKVVSGSRDAMLRVWDVTTGECLHVLVGHVAAVRCVQYDGRLVVSGAYDFTVKVWDPEREECLHTLSGHTNRVYSLQFDGVHIVSGSLDTSIRVWDAETGQAKHTLMGHQSLTSGMELRQNILVSGNADSTVKIWDITTGKCLQTLSGANKHQSAVTCLQFNNKFVVTSSDDGTVKLWDLKTGEFVRNLIALDSGGSGGVVWRIRASETKLVCAVGSRNGTEETKLLVLDFDAEK